MSFSRILSTTTTPSSYLRGGTEPSILLPHPSPPDTSKRRTQMPLVKAKGLVHFSLPANDVEESLKFYTEVLGMEFRGNVGPTGRCVVAGDVNIILVGRPM